jgi:geranylgeranyl reductase family protein
MSAPSRLSCDILVVGLGPAGASAALAAAARGASVIAVDRRPVIGQPVQCGEFVPLSLTQETPAVMEAAIQPIAAMDTYVEGIGPRRDPLPGWIIDRARFDQAIAALARDAGAACLVGVGVTGFSAHAARLSDGAQVEASVIIGADGPHSLVGAALGHVNPALAHARQITVPLIRPHDATDIFLTARLPGGYGWLFPKGMHANLGVGVATEWRQALPQALAALRQALIDAGRIGPEARLLTGGALPAGGLVGCEGRLGDRLALLAGDAAGLTNPITGGGIAAAVISGRMAGEAAADHVFGAKDAAADYAEDIAALFGRALARASSHRARLLSAHAAGLLTPETLRRGWIADDAYWTDAPPPAPHQEGQAA